MNPCADVHIRKAMYMYIFIAGLLLYISVFASEYMPVIEINRKSGRILFTLSKNTGCDLVKQFLFSYDVIR